MGRPAPPSRLARLLLLGSGSLLILLGLAGAAVGVLLPDRILALLPPVDVDAAAIGGAIVTLAVASAGAGVALVGLGLWLGRARWASAVALVVLGMLAALLTALGVALLTEVAAGSSAWLVVPGGVLLAVAAACATVAWRLARSARGSSREGG